MFSALQSCWYILMNYLGFFSSSTKVPLTTFGFRQPAQNVLCVAGYFELVS